MLRYLSEQDVRGLLTMADALECVEQAMKARALGRAVDVPRVRTRIPEGTQHVLQAAAPDLGYIGFKYYYTTPRGKSMYVHLMRIADAKLEAIIAADWMGIVRTGAASGVASKHLAVKGASVLAQLGAGRQGVGQLEAVCRALGIRQVRVYARTRDRLEAWCREQAQRLGIEVVPASSAPAALDGAHVVNVITKSATPVLHGDWLQPGQHINAAGSNALNRVELDETAVQRCDLVTVDSRGTAANECGDLLAAAERGWLQWEALPEIGEIIAGRAPGRTSERQITLYESHGMGIQDLYVCARLLALARERGVGNDLSIGA